MAGGGDAADVAAPSGADTCLDRGDLRVADGAGDGFDRGPAQQPGALLICGTTVVKPRGICAKSFLLDLLRWPLDAVGRCRGPGSGVSPTAQRPQALSGAGLAASSPLREARHRGSRSAVAHRVAPVGCRPGLRSARGAGAPAYLGARPAGAGDKMAIGVSRRVRPLILGRLSGAGRQQQGCWELAAGSSVGRARNARPAGAQAAGAVRRRGRGPGRRGCAGCGGSGGRACGPSTAAPAARRDGI